MKIFTPTPKQREQYNEPRFPHLLKLCHMYSSVCILFFAKVFESKTHHIISPLQTSAGITKTHILARNDNAFLQPKINMTPSYYLIIRSW